MFRFRRPLPREAVWKVDIRAGIHIQPKPEKIKVRSESQAVQLPDKPFSDGLPYFRYRMPQPKRTKCPKEQK